MAGDDWKAVTPVFLIGLGVGAAIGFLFAVKSGEETIEEIAGAMDDLSGAVEDRVDGIVTKGRKMGRRVQRTIENARESVREVAAAGEQALREVKDRVS